MTSANVTIVTMVILLMGGLVFYEVHKTVASPHKHSPVCKNMDIVGVKKGIIVKTEDDGRYVYVSKKWESILIDEKDEIGHWLALCRSPDEWVEIRNAESGEKIHKYVIDMHYKATHGLSLP